jgi:type IX secretion system PorP/SprF family membrane protein
MKMKNIVKIAVCLLAVVNVQELKAQLNPLGAQYYNNEYLINPAYAGKEKGLKLNAAYRKLWGGLPGAPLTQNITADYGFNRVGIGVNVNNESAGLLRQTRATASYAYHLPLDSGKHQLHFGLSLGVMSQHLDNNNVNGNPNDISIGDYNGRRAYIDGDFGIAYTSDRLSLQATIPNLNDFFNKNQYDVADLVTFYSAVAYNFTLKEGIELEPKVAFRGIRNYENMLDFGAKLSFADRKFFFMGIYHTNKSSTMGLGLDFMKKYMISGLYTTETSALNTYANGSFELNLRINFAK